MTGKYPAYSDSRWFGNLPSHWLEMPLKFQCTYNDEVLSELVDDDYEIEYVDIGSVSSTEGISKYEKISFGKAPSRARRIVRDGDVIVSTVRTYLEAIAPIKSPPANLIVSTGFVVIRPKARLNKNFASYALRAKGFIEEVVTRSVGISYPAINASDLVSIYSPVPNLEEQETIANFLDHETAKIDTLIDKQQQLIKLLKEKRQAVISHAVTKGLNPDAPMKDSGVEWLGEVPEGWEEIKVKRLFKFAKRQGYEDLTVLSVYRDHGVIVKSSRGDNFNKTPENLSAYQLVNDGDLVINKMKAWQGSMGISGFKGITSPDYAVFRPLRSFKDSYLHFWFRASHMPDVYRNISTGIRPSQWRLDLEKFEQLNIFFPPEEERVVIVQEIWEIESKYLDLIGLAETQITLLQERRTALISAAVTGKIDVRNWESEQVENRMEATT